ncbi:D-tyrosyl-tRNA(Tyr) deacylase [Candidatus Roizmanbacteria bacterium]|nr:MAG: D-tyrosyl-tRNA(Tyr) deacylase [Candidatus Roizmanbacteria bacterium]
MISLIQRVTQAAVYTNSACFSEISHGYAILVGIYEDDTQTDVEKSVNKILNLRIMSDEADKMNRSILDTKGEVLLVSQFTLCGDISGGRRPSFIKAKKPDEAYKLYKYMIELLKKQGLAVKTGKFGNYMDVRIHNDGPVTILVDSTKI